MTNLDEQCLTLKDMTYSIHSHVIQWLHPSYKQTLLKDILKHLRLKLTSKVWFHAAQNHSSRCTVSTQVHHLVFFGFWRVDVERPSHSPVRITLQNCFDPPDWCSSMTAAVMATFLNLSLCPRGPSKSIQEGKMNFACRCTRCIVYVKIQLQCIFTDRYR